MKWVTGEIKGLEVVIRDKTFSVTIKASERAEEEFWLRRDGSSLNVMRVELI